MICVVIERNCKRRSRGALKGLGTAELRIVRIVHIQMIR
jgi:hypothetical protein